MTDVPTLMPVPLCNVRIGRMQFYHPDQAKARQFAKRPKPDGLMSMLVIGAVMIVLGVIWVSYRVFSPPAPLPLPPRPGQAQPPGLGPIQKVLRVVLPLFLLVGGAVMTISALVLMDAPNKMLDDKALLRDCVPN